MHPLPYEKAILRRTVPTWQEIICDNIVKGTLSKSDIGLGKFRKHSASAGKSRLGLQNVLLIVSPGCDCSRLLFYLLLYTINPLHVYDTETYRNSIDIPGDTPTEKPNLCLQNVSMSLRSTKLYHRIFNLASTDSEDAKNHGIIPQIFHNMKLRSVVDVGCRLIFIIGLFADEAVTTASHFGQIINQLCYSTADVPNNRSVKLPMPVFIEGSVLAHDREKMYIEGGIYSVPSRILLVDLLTGKLTPEIVSGIVIVHAHRMAHDYNIPFLIKLLRSRNKLAFIKAITDNVISMREEGRVNFVLKSMFTSDCFIYPRCSSCIDSVLNDPEVQPETYEINLQLSDNAKQIHNTIVQLLQRLMTDLQRQLGDELQHLDMNAIMYTSNVDRLFSNALQKAYVSANSYHIRRSMASISNLKMLLNQLYNMDAISFLAFGESMKEAESDSHWLWTSYGNIIYKLATARVYEPDPQYESGVSLNIEQDKKGECLRQILCPKYIGNAELVELIRSAMKWIPSKRLSRLPSRYSITTKANLSMDQKRRRLNHREGKHARRIYRYFKAGNTLARRAIIVVDNNFLCTNLRKSLTMSLSRYNEAKFMAYANKRADRYDSKESEEQKYDGYTETHFHRVMINTRKEADKVLRKFVIWSRYNEIYGKKGDKVDIDESGQANQEPETRDFASICPESEEDDSPHGMDFMEHGLADPVTMDASSDSEGSDADKSVEKKPTQEKVAPKRFDAYTLTLDVGKDIKCITNVVNVSFNPPRNEALKGLMERKLLKDAENDTVPIMCSPHEFGYALRKFKPTVIAVYRPNVKVFRVIEQYCALHSASGGKRFLKVYIMSYVDCLESHKFARDLKHELECWRTLQQQLKSLQITYDETVLLTNRSNMGNQQSLTNTAALEASGTLAIASDANVKLPNVNIQNVRLTPQVIIDMREFKSKLPFHLYYNGLQLVPIVLEMGDYLLTRDICVERKSLKDLITSLTSGRLAQQAEELCSVYDLPLLLVEFDDAESFHLSPCNDAHSLGINYVYSKLCILCCNYPKLKVIWSQSPEKSAHIFMTLKKGRSEPDISINTAVIAAARGDCSPENGSSQVIIRRKPEDVKNRDALKVLRKIPGVTSYNIGEILSRVGSLRQLSEMEESDLAQFLPACNARAIYNFFNQPFRGYRTYSL